MAKERAGLYIMVFIAMLSSCDADRRTSTILTELREQRILIETLMREGWTDNDMERLRGESRGTGSEG